MSGREDAAVREATAAAIDPLRDGVRFAVIAGSHVADDGLPGDGRSPVPMDARPGPRPRPRSAGSAPTAAPRSAPGCAWRPGCFAAVPGVTARHGILLTDGRNEHETPESLDAALDGCAGQFQCDCRGVGTDWEVEEVRRIATALLGTADLVAADADGRRLHADDAPRPWARGSPTSPCACGPRRGRRSCSCKQVSPTVEDLTAPRHGREPATGDYPTGSWGDESRDYHVGVRVPARAVGQEMLAARVLVAARPTTVVAQGLVKAVWSNDDTDGPHQPRRRALHRAGRARPGHPAGPGGQGRGDVDGATVKLGRAVQLADRDGQRGGDDAAAQDRRDRGCRHRHRPAQAQRQQARRDGPRHGLDQDDPGEEVTASCAPAGRPWRRLGP